MYSILVLQCGVDPRYVLDGMELYEMVALIDNLWMKDRTSWEQTRTISYITAQCQSTKKLDPMELMPFTWDRKEEKHIDTQEEKDEMMREMKRWEDIMNKKDNQIDNGK